MDTPIISNDSYNPSVYNLAEIWPFGMINVPGLRMGGGGGGDVSIAESSSVVTEQRNYSLGTMKRKHGNSKVKDEEDDLNNFNRKHTKLTKSRVENGDSKSKKEANSEPENKSAKQSTKPCEPPKQDFIHVRARRGQATDSHSLAERARRVKISERMKILQDLVPGCNKIIGKALVLDEIINYIQSLQSQVEFLSTKLEAVNSWMSSPTERFSSKELGIPIFDATGILYGSQDARDYMQASQSELLLMQLGSTFNRPT